MKKIHTRILLAFIFLALAAVYLIVLALVQSTLQSIFQAALYVYASGGMVPVGFKENLLRESMRQRNR